MRANRLLERLRDGRLGIGCSVMIPSPQVVEMLAYAGFDWVLLDCEHGSLAPGDVELMCIAADAAGITPIARPRTSSPADIQTVLDRGAMGVQIPHVSSAEDARRAVAAVRFGPNSTRSLALGTRPDRWGLGEPKCRTRPSPLPDFAAEANATTLLCVQLEDGAAIRNADEILAVDGIDVFFIGPSDLSQSLGHAGDPGAAPVAEAIEQTLRKIVAAGKIAGMPARSANAAARRASGVRYIYTHLPHVIASGATEFLRAASSTD